MIRVLAAVWLTACPAFAAAAEGAEQPPAASAGGAARVVQGKLPEMAGDALRDRIDEVLRFTYRERQMSLQENAAWQILHGVLAFGRDFEVLDGDQPVNTLDWLFAGKPMRGWTMTPTEFGLRAEIEPGRFGQGHEDQWLAIIAQCHVPHDQKIKVGAEEYQVYDLIRRSMYDCYEGKESSWTIIELSHYLKPLDQTWQARDGETWSLGRLAGMEAGPSFDEMIWMERILGAACGGTHRLIGLAMALNRWKAAYPDRELTADWQAVQARVRWAIATAREYQLPNGAFSIMFFQRPSNSRSIDEHLAATGHILEFLSLSLSREQLQEAWVRRAVVFLCDLLERTRKLDLECGALYHAAHGLVLYRQSVWGEPGDW
ncbi:MAG: ADP-ribosylation factor-directed GTPase activating protein isoform b [Pirellulales bacterium]|nr:ADP-ribosylation factor-directed GTPase activating protein isoform b [Pirellulales bacterium]